MVRDFMYTYMYAFLCQNLSKNFKKILILHFYRVPEA